MMIFFKLFKFGVFVKKYQNIVEKIEIYFFNLEYKQN